MSFAEVSLISWLSTGILTKRSWLRLFDSRGCNAIVKGVNKVGFEDDVTGVSKSVNAMVTEFDKEEENNHQNRASH